MRILFISWDAPFVNYVESLFLPAFVGLKQHDIHVDILQFRWGATEAREKLAAECAAHGIGYASVPLWRRPTNSLGTLLTIVRGKWAIRSAVRKFKPDVIMPRGLFPAMAALLAGGRTLRPVIFDADGLEADARVEGGLSQTGIAYRVMREVEAQAARISEATLVRTRFNAEVIRIRAGPLMGENRLHVMTCGRDSETFKPLSEQERRSVRNSLGFAESDPVVVYIGSVWAQYRTADIARFVAALRKREPAAKLLFLTGQVEEARRLLCEGDTNVGADAVIMTASAADAPKLIAAADVGMSLFKVGFGSRAQSPIKLGEYLMCGVPVIGTVAVGETGPAVEAGVFFDESAGPEAAAEWLLGKVMPARREISATAREIGVSCFSLNRTVEQYVRVVESVELSRRR